jgi:large subunit ribosomal protein L15
MDLSNLQRNTARKTAKRVGRGGKRGFSSGGGTKGQKSRAGATVRPGFRGGDNRIWQLFPKQRGASKKPGSKAPHRKHRFYRLRHEKSAVLNMEFFNQFAENELVTPKILKEKGLIKSDNDISENRIKILGDGVLKRKLQFEGFDFSKTAREKVSKLGGIIK